MKASFINSTALCLFTTIATVGQLDFPGADGSDGAFSPTGNVVVDLSEAISGVWTNASLAPGKGIYDTNKWAVVFNYRSVTIPAGVSVQFQNHPSRAPVVWLVSGDVVIDGSLLLNASDATAPEVWSEPGPGGFRDAYVDSVGGAGRDGFGPGGGVVALVGPGGAGGNFATLGSENLNKTLYGNSRVLPLIGGSGGGASRVVRVKSGGGAILIASKGRIIVQGQIQANGGGQAGILGAGSGGAVRLICDRLEGDGRIAAISNGGGGDGRIRLEARSFLGALRTDPLSEVVNPDAPVLIWPPEDAPTVRVAFVNGQPAPLDPRSSLGLGTDLNVQSPGEIEIDIETTHLATNSVVIARIVPIQGMSQQVVATYVNGDESRAAWKAKAELLARYAAIQVQAMEP